MGGIRAAVERLQETMELLKSVGDSEPARPKAKRFFETMNGSVVWIMYIDSDGDALAVVLKGGHGIATSRGEKPGELYMVDDEGYYKCLAPSAEMCMSLLRLLPIDLDDFGRPSE